MTELSVEGDEETKQLKRRKNSIFLTDNKIDVEGATVISDALKANTTLTKLNIGSDGQKIKKGGQWLFYEVDKQRIQ